MAGFPKKERQRIIDEYLVESGNNMYVPHVFIDWLREMPDHEAYDWFYGFDDTHHARENRIHLARKIESIRRLSALYDYAIMAVGMSGLIRRVLSLSRNYADRGRLLWRLGYRDIAVVLRTLVWT